jgi:serine/threonine protein kinase
MDDNIGNPIPFPPPIFGNGEIRRIQIRDASFDDVPDNIRLNPCLLSITSHTVYEIGRKIKDAIYGAVYIGCVLNRINDTTFERSHVYVAIKRISKRRLSEIGNLTQEDPIKEIAAMQFLRSPGSEYVMTQIECVQNAENIFSIMQFCTGGELFDFVDADGAMTEANARVLFTHILNGLEYLQSKGVCHRDLSLENILIHENKCVIIDMGMCLRLPMNETTGYPLLIPPQGTCGKKNYVSPEVHLDMHPFSGFAVDIWAVGVILFLLLTGVPPVEVANEVDARFRMIQDHRLSRMLSDWNITISESAMDLLQKILEVDPSERYTLDDIRNHPWMHEHEHQHQQEGDDDVVN